MSKHLESNEMYIVMGLINPVNHTAHKHKHRFDLRSSALSVDGLFLLILHHPHPDSILCIQPLKTISPLLSMFTPPYVIFRGVYMIHSVSVFVCLCSQVDHQYELTDFNQT